MAKARQSYHPILFVVIALIAAPTDAGPQIASMSA